MDCSVVIRAYNEARHLPRLLEGIAHQTRREVEIILVDSGSTDGTAEIASAYGARIVSISPVDFTFGRSLNLGLEAATGELAVIASAHVYPVYSDWLNTLLRPFQDAAVAVVYGKQRGTAQSWFSEQQVFRQWFPDWDIANQNHPFCNNANCAIRRSLWKEHAYDETLTGLEDLAWARWAQSQGGEVVYRARAEVVHVHEEALRGVYERYRREGMAFKRIFPESHFNIYDCVRLASANSRSDLVQAGRDHALWRNAGSILAFRGAQFWGTYQGYRHSSAVTRELRARFYYPQGIEPPDSAKWDAQPIRYNEAKADAASNTHKQS
jgi:glycosyltransferase involved in cell wall biosynthesis